MISVFSSLNEALVSLFDTSVKILKKYRVQGGDINVAWRVDLNNGTTLFIKTNSAKNLNFFKTESTGLEALRSLNTVSIPKVLAVGTDDGTSENGNFSKTETTEPHPFSFIIMEFLKSIELIPEYWETFGRELAQMHLADTSSIWPEAKPENVFGFFEDNYIGMTKQTNTPHKSWIEFYRDCRLMPQIELAKENFDDDTMAKFEKLLLNLDRFLVEPAKPSLIHGDLWHGNIHTGPDGKAWILDPAAYIGHSEADLAMTHLFEYLPAQFYSAYNEVNKIDSGYSQRQELYHLYHLLNHLNMFGSSYYDEVINILHKYV